ncbi:hypothetical protein [Fusobacterium polymorphum]|uniref:hypothetical protein n=1 Tax=Fusobacterium nucleatum subsp. polymorphum TaxID=76857 RepID=UPI00300A6132
MDFKTGKIAEIVREFLANNGDKFEINGVDLSRAVFLYRMKNTSFEPIPKGNYSTKEESNILYLKVDDVIKAKAYEYQIIYVSEMKAGKYLETYPELKVLVSKYNDLVEDVTNIIKHAKTTGVKVDTLKMTQILTPLEPNTFWAMNKDGIIETYPLGDLNSKYEQMVNALKKEIEELIKATKETSLSEIEATAKNKISEFAEELKKKINELKNGLSSAVAKYITDNRNKLKGDRGAGITSITAIGDEVTVNYDDSQTTTFTVPTIAGKDGKSLEIRKVFKGSFEVNKKNKITPINIGNNWKILFLKVVSDFQAQGDKDSIYIKDNENNYKFIINPEFSGTFKINNGIIEFYIERDYVSLRILEASVME